MCWEFLSSHFQQTNIITASLATCSRLVIFGSFFLTIDCTAVVQRSRDLLRTKDRVAEQAAVQGNAVNYSSNVVKLDAVA